MVFSIASDTLNATLDRRALFDELLTAGLSSAAWDTLSLEINPDLDDPDRFDLEAAWQPGDEALVESVVAAHRGVAHTTGPLVVTDPTEIETNETEITIASLVANDLAWGVWGFHAHAELRALVTNNWARLRIVGSPGGELATTAWNGVNWRFENLYRSADLPAGWSGSVDLRLACLVPGGLVRARRVRLVLERL